MKRTTATTLSSLRLGGRRAASSTSGFSIIELLVALIIIGILVTVITPRVANRADEARRTRALSDMENIQNAQEKAVVDTNFFVRLHVLDDVSGIGDGIPPQNPQDPDDVIDALADEGIAGTIYQNSRQLFISPSNGLLLGAVAADALYTDLSATDSETPFGQTRWAGPYLTYQIDANHPNDGGPTYVGDDPYGNDYLFFTRAGLVVEPDGIIVTTITGSALFQRYGGTAPAGIAGFTYDCQLFDRAAVVSLGPNGVPGDGTDPSGAGSEGQLGRGDDIVRKF
jgi:prepilin-type N-terminal cleavage/methylation domain-containing protein